MAYGMDGLRLLRDLRFVVAVVFDRQFHHSIFGSLGLGHDCRTSPHCGYAKRGMSGWQVLAPSPIQASQSTPKKSPPKSVNDLLSSGLTLLPWGMSPWFVDPRQSACASNLGLNDWNTVDVPGLGAQRDAKQCSFRPSLRSRRGRPSGPSLPLPLHGGGLAGKARVGPHRCQS